MYQQFQLYNTYKILSTQNRKALFFSPSNKSFGEEIQFPTEPLFHHNPEIITHIYRKTVTLKTALDNPHRNPKSLRLLTLSLPRAHACMRTHTPHYIRARARHRGKEPGRPLCGPLVSPRAPFSLLVRVSQLNNRQKGDVACRRSPR